MRFPSTNHRLMSQLIEYDSIVIKTVSKVSIVKQDPSLDESTKSTSHHPSKVFKTSPDIGMMALIPPSAVNAASLSTRSLWFLFGCLTSASTSVNERISRPHSRCFIPSSLLLLSVTVLTGDIVTV